MTSQVLSGTSNPSYTNNTTQNVRVVINYMYSNSEDIITINWAGQSITEGNVEAIGKNIACGSAFYGDYFTFGWNFFNWFSLFTRPSNPRSALSTQNVAIKLPTTQARFSRVVRGWDLWYRNTSSTSEISGFSLSIALPLEIFLAPGQTFSAVCGPHNILVLKEDGN
jgi:hypothetical protein